MKITDVFYTTNTCTIVYLHRMLYIANGKVGEKWGIAVFLLRW